MSAQDIAVVKSVRFDADDEHTLARLCEEYYESISEKNVGNIVYDIEAFDMRYADPSLSAMRIGDSITVEIPKGHVGPMDTEEIELVITRIETDILKLSKKITVGDPAAYRVSDYASGAVTSANKSDTTEYRKIQSIDDLPVGHECQNATWFIPKE